jgi:hypothetical protein
MRLFVRVMPIVVAGSVAAGSVAFAQPPKPDPTMRQMLLAGWTEIGEKVVKMAEEFPADKYDFRPVDGVRTFADQMRHVAFWHQFVAKTSRGEPIDAAINELSAKDYPDKASIVAVLRRSFAAATAELTGGPADLLPRKAALWVTFTEHTGEHYGQLVVYFRLNGIVPPASRPGL